MARPSRRLNARARWAATVVVAVSIGGVALTSCSSGSGLGAEACQRVAVAARDAHSAAAATPSAARSLRLHAEQQLEAAESLAADAAGADATYQGLQATLQEAGSIPLTDVLSAAQRNCEASKGG